MPCNTTPGLKRMYFWLSLAAAMLLLFALAVYPYARYYTFRYGHPDLTFPRASYTGEWAEYDEGILKKRYRLKNGLFDGMYERMSGDLFPSAHIQITYRNGIKHGPYIDRDPGYPDGVRLRAEFENGVLRHVMQFLPIQPNERPTVACLWQMHFDSTGNYVDGMSTGNWMLTEFPEQWRQLNQAFPWTAAIPEWYRIHPVAYDVHGREVMPEWATQLRDPSTQQMLRAYATEHHWIWINRLFADNPTL